MRSKRERKSAHWPDLASFFREGEAWVLRQIVFDAALPPMAARAAACVRLSVNFETGVSEVGVSTIAAALGVSDDTVPGKRRGGCSPHSNDTVLALGNWIAGATLPLPRSPLPHSGD